MSARTNPLPVLLLALLAWSVPGCGGDVPPGSGMPARVDPIQIRVTEAMADASTSLKVGHVLRIELPAHPLRGFAWEIDSVDESVLRIPVEEYAPPDVEGEPGTSIWSFHAIGAGTTTVKLRYVNFGEDVPAEARTFSFRVLVD